MLIGVLSDVSMYDYSLMMMSAQICTGNRVFACPPLGKRFIIDTIIMCTKCWGYCIHLVDPTDVKC